MKKRTTIYVDSELWDNFMKYIIEVHGKTHGGVISEEVEKAIQQHIKKKK
ncbi:MAG: hypothetical protein ACQCN3_12355 [Candidatus Bathyarchaeia archaeon]